MNRLRPQGGFGLIEVLVTLLIVTGGLLAYVGLQRGVFREANLASGRVAATETAMSKLEDLRSFTALQTTVGEFAFEDIADDVGGAIAAGTATIDNVELTTGWTVTDYWYTGVNAAPTDTAPAGDPMPSFKQVVITVSWTDQNAQAQTLSLRSNIAGIDPQLTGTLFY
ncbi:MAG: type IV pilus modification PilV family protein [Panacagrimonas sp.]